MKLSAVIISKNAEDQIGNAIDSVSFADEIIVVDNGSTDKTAEIAKYLKAKVFNITSNDFSELRNYGLDKAKGEWILYIDTDEIVSKELETNIKNQISNVKNEESRVYKIKRKNFYLGNHEWPKIEKLERLFKKNALKGWYGKLHESPKVDGQIGELDGFLLHYTHKDLRSMLEKTLIWSKVEADLRFKANHPKMTWWRFPRVMFSAFFDSYFKQEGWKIGIAGLIESVYQSFSIFITYARLWELQNGIKDEE